MFVRTQIENERPKVKTSYDKPMILVSVILMKN